MPKIVDHEERRRAIASAAVDAIAAHGLEGVKLADISRAAGVSTGAVGHYFEDKDAVLAAALEEVCTRLFIEMGKAEGRFTVQGIGDCLPICDENRKEWRVWLAYWGRAPFSERLREIHRQHYLDIEQALIEEMGAAFDDPAQIAGAVIAALDGIGTRATLEPEAWPEARQRAVLSALLTPLLSPTRSME